MAALFVIHCQYY